MEMWIPLISEYGFPVMITLYLLHRIEKKLDLLNDAVTHLATALLHESSFDNEAKKQVKINA